MGSGIQGAISPTSVPIGSVGGLPVGGQLLAPWWGEAKMFAGAGALEVARRSAP